QLLKEPADYILSCQQALEQRPDHSIRGQQHTKGSQALERAETGVPDGKQGGKPPARTLQVESVIMLGHLLEDYKRLIARHEIDLLVLNTKDEDQLAMHGLAYPLAIEMREIPLLLL
ncbi:MAG: hypothetical protein VB817_07795, partial [Pirellulaceae bacterium]